MTGSSPARKAKHDRRRAHQREQARKKREALEQATHEATNLAKNGTPLKKPRTGKALESALLDRMKERGYEPVKRTRKVRLPKSERVAGRSGSMKHGTHREPVSTKVVTETVWMKIHHAEPTPAEEAA